MNKFADLRSLVEAEGPFLTVAFPTPSDVGDAQHRFDVEWKNARRHVDPSRWSPGDIADLDAIVSSLPHDGGASLVLIRAGDGSTLAEFLDDPVSESFVVESAAPRLSLVIEGRQRSIPHIMVETDRAGADIHTFEGGRVLGTDQVEGDTEFIHRGHPGGWSQRRYQQRAENTWERNADDVAAAIVEADRRVAAELIFVSGDVRARHLVLESLPEHVRRRTVLIEAGSPGGIADEVVRLVADHVARQVRELSQDVKERLGTGTASTDVAEVLAGLEAGSVKHLLVYDDGTDGPTTEHVVGGVPAGARVVDASIVAALRSGAEITVVPMLSVLDGPVAALHRW